MSIDDDEIRRQLVKYRKHRKMSQEDLASAMRTGRSTVAKIEGGALALRTSWLNRMEEPLGLHVTVVISDRDDHSANASLAWAMECLLHVHSERVKAGYKVSVEESARQCARAFRWCYRNGQMERQAIEAKVKEYLDI